MSALQEREVHRKRRLVLLPPQRRLEPRMAAVDADAVAGNVRGREERQPHDVIPVHMGHEDVIRLRRLRAVARERRLAERARAAPQVADDVLRLAGLDLDAGRVSAVGPDFREGEAVDVALDVGIRPESAARCAAQRGNDLVAHDGRGERDRERPARAPEPDAFHRAAGGRAPSKATSAAGENCPIASRTVGKTPSTRSKRLMAKISATIGCRFATAIFAPRRAQLLRGDHQDAQADAADVVDAREVEHQDALAVARRFHEGQRARPRARRRCGDRRDRRAPRRRRRRIGGSRFLPCGRRSDSRADCTRQR